MSENSPLHFSLTALSPLDGRYSQQTAALSCFFSESALIKHRTEVEVEWLLALSKKAEIKELSCFSGDDRTFLQQLYSQFDSQKALRVKEIEGVSRHDVKAVEMWLREEIEKIPTLSEASSFLHFVCTSEDINNVSYALMIRRARDQVLVPLLEIVIQQLRKLAHQYAHLPMLSRTHGQTATPTTLGKEMANYVARLEHLANELSQIKVMAKFNGAVGNYNAHRVAYPDVNWPEFCQSFIESFGLTFNPYSTQIEPHDTLGAVFSALARIDGVLLDLSRDMWMYISLAYFKQKTMASEVGSSTMPHKVNPIDFENAEGNLGLASAMFHHMTDKLAVSRWQRDLSDSTVLRHIGSAFAHFSLACQSLERGLNRVEVNEQAIYADVSEAWEVLAEPIQTVMRRFGIVDAYEQLKKITRGKAMDEAILKEFIKTLSIPESNKKALLALTPQSYIGEAVRLAQSV